jgi:hypothetical protein
MLMMLIYWAGSLHAIRKNTEAFLTAREEIGLEVNPEETLYMMSRDQKAGQIGNIQAGNKSFETVKEFKYLG